jgi:para-aminobenzoate synthetase component 1
MRALLEEIPTPPTPEALAQSVLREPGLVLLRSASHGPTPGRYSLLTARPFLTLRAHGSHCELFTEARRQVCVGDPWQVLAHRLAHYELADEADRPFPLGGAFGYWGYDLRHFVEPRLPRRAPDPLALPDCWVGFYASLVAFDHQLGKAWLVATGLQEDGARSAALARAQADFWRAHLERAPAAAPAPAPRPPAPDRLTTSLPRPQFLAAVQRARRYIHAGDIYQVNLAQQLAVQSALSGWELYRRLADVSPAPFAAFLDAGDFQLASSSPELFLRMSGTHIQSRPIKGTRPRDADPTRDAQLACELQASPKENAELIMITDLQRNDLGRVCEFGSVQVPDLLRLERFAQVQHLVSTVEGRLRPALSHLQALAACFPGGSVTGAPKFRAMEIIDELEPVARGPYTGALGYLGFNGQSQFSILIRTALHRAGTTWFHTGAGIVADSDPEAEYAETLAKAGGFFAALECVEQPDFAPSLTAQE